MLTKRVVVLMLLTGLTAVPALAQWPTLSNVVRAKMDTKDGKPQVILMLQSYRMEKTDRPVRVTKTRSEQRSRTVVRDGKQVEMTYTVAVPYTEMVNEVSRPAGLKPNTFDAGAFQIYDLAGDVVDVEEASKRLNKLSPIFLMERFRRGFRPVPELQRSVLNPDTLVFTSPEQIRKRQNGSPYALPNAVVPAKLRPALPVKKK